MSYWYDPWGVVSSVYHGVTGAPTAKEKRDQANLVSEQINAYKSQTAMAQDEIRRKQGEQAAEKRRIQEKQIRGLRRNFRPAGFLNTSADVSSQLGA